MIASEEISTSWNLREKNLCSKKTTLHVTDWWGRQLPIPHLTIGVILLHMSGELTYTFWQPPAPMVGKGRDRDTEREKWKWRKRDRRREPCSSSPWSSRINDPIPDRPLCLPTARFQTLLFNTSPGVWCYVCMPNQIFTPPVAHTHKHTHKRTHKHRQI